MMTVSLEKPANASRGVEQAGDRARQHDAESHHVGGDPFPGEQHDCDRDDGQADGDFGSHGDHRRTAWPTARRWSGVSDRR